MSHRPPRLAGSSLIEILVATLVVGLVLTSVAFLMSMNVKSSTEAEMRAQAAVFAQQGVDLVRNKRVNLTWNAFVTGGTLTTAPACTNTTGTLTFANTAFERTCSFNPATPSGNSMTTLTVIVTWPRGAASPNSVQVRQRFYNR